MSDLLRASNLQFSYANQMILRDVSLSLAAGEVVSLLGANGVGKTTLIRALAGHLRAEGQIEWHGRALEKWGRREIAREIAYLPQTPSSEAAQTVLEVLRLGRAPYWTSFGIESARDVEVVNKIASLLNLEELLARPMDQLSGGQRQRVFIGRCLVQEPAALLLDEPSTFLDLRHQIELFELLRKLAREKNLGVLIASHDLNLAAGFSDRLILLHDGTILATGNASEVLRTDVLEKAYGVPIERIERADGRPIVVPVHSTI